MNCREFEADVVDLARGVGMSAAAAERAGAHMERCHLCAARFARQRQLTTALKAVADSAPPSPRAAAIEAQLLRAFAERHAAAAQHPTAVRQAPAPRTRLTTPGAMAWIAAAAVVVLAVAGWQGVARWLANGQSGSNSAQAPAPAPAEGVRADAPRPESRRAADLTPATVPAPADARPAAAVAPDELGRPAGPPRPSPAVDDGALLFVALPTAIGLPAFESGRIVRVELPTAMLPAYGIDIAPDPESGMVEADVLIGQDGQPRAIRFVTLDSDSRRRQ